MKTKKMVYERIRLLKEYSEQLKELQSGILYDIYPYDNDTLERVTKELQALVAGERTLYSEYGCGDEKTDSVISYIDDEIEPDLSLTSNDTIIGSEQPDKLLEIVKAWNPEIQERAYRALLPYQEKADAAGISVAEYFKQISMTELGKTYLLADLREAFSELSGKLCYGQGKLVFGAELNLKECIGYFNGTIIHERLLNDVLAHPEAYALITVYYD